MRRFFEIQAPCRDRAGAAEGGGGRAVIAPGAPVEVGSTPDPKVKPAEKSDADKLREDYDKKFGDLQKQLDEARQSERYWADRARGGQPASDPQGDDDTDDTPAQRLREPDAITPEQFLDVLSKEGPAGLKRFGFMTEADVAERTREIEERADRKLQQAQAHATYDARLAQEFP